MSQSVQTRVTACVLLSLSLFYSGTFSQPLFVVPDIDIFKNVGHLFYRHFLQLAILGASWELHSGRFWGLFHGKSEITDSSNGFSNLISVQLSRSVMSDMFNSCPWTAARQASLSITNIRSLLKLMSIELVMPSNHLILCLSLLLLPSFFPSIRVFSVSQYFTSGDQSIDVST